MPSEPSAKLLPIGSVIELGGRRSVVVGHRIARNGTAVDAAYVLVPFPLGFVDSGSLMMVQAGRVHRIVAEGLSCEEGAAYLEELEGLARASAAIPYVEFEQATALLGALAAEGGAGDAE